MTVAPKDIVCINEDLIASAITPNITSGQNDRGVLRIDCDYCKKNCNKG